MLDKDKVMMQALGHEYAKQVIDRLKLERLSNRNITMLSCATYGESFLLRESQSIKAKLCLRGIGLSPEA